MTKLASLCFSAAVLFFGVLSINNAHAIGDVPDVPGLNYEPGIISGCSKWNWQQYAWYDHCPAYVHPKAYMYRRSSYRTVLRARV